MNITIVSRHFNMSGGGGSTYSLNLLCSHLSDKGHEVKLYVTEPRDLPENTDYEILTTPDSDRLGRSSIQIAKEVYKTLDRLSDFTDIFHIFNPTLLPVAGLYKRRNPEIVIVGRLNTYTTFCTNQSMMNGTCHKNCSIRDKFNHEENSLEGKVSRLPLYATRTYLDPKLMNNLDAFFALSPAVKDIYTDVGIRDDLISVIPNAYDSSFQESDDSVDFSPESFTVLYAGRLIKPKGVDVLLEAVTHLDDTSRVHVDIVGDGSQKDELVTRSSDLGIEDSVQFHGRVPHDELPEYYVKADVFVHPGRWPEPFGRTILEALQNDCPPVVSNIGGPPWIIGDAGFTFERENPVSLSNRLSTLRDNPEVLAEKAERCSHRVEQFSPESVINSIIEEYRRCLD